MKTVEAFAPAKINLTLHVTGQRPDGYHLLDSLVVFGDVGDHLTLTPNTELQLDVTGPFAAGVPVDDTNLVWRAAEAAGWRGHIRLEKNLPHGAGIGGGSADAAALLRALNGDDVTQGIGLGPTLALGADVPVCMHAGPQRMQGTGAVLSRVWPVPTLDLVLINPGVGVATPDVFQILKTTQNADMSLLPKWRSRSDFMSWLEDQRNDLESATRQIVSEIDDVLDAFAGAKLARMSGSGTTCFGVYDSRSEAREAAQVVAKSHPEWWVHPTQTVGKEM